MKYLKDREYYQDLYDQMTISVQESLADGDEVQFIVQ
jgi:hypothetical protein